MRISSRAWHLRLVRFIKESYVPTDLCSYFWTVVWIVVAVLSFAVAALMTSPIWGPLLLLQLWTERVQQRAKSGQERPPNLLLAWVRAKKAKVCPLITVVEEERENVVSKLSL